MSTVTYDIRKERGVDKLTQFSIDIAGDVGYGMSGTIVGSTVSQGAALTLLLDGGQALDMVVDVPKRIKRGKYQAYEFTAFEKGATAFKKSLGKSHQFLTMTENEWVNMAAELTKRGLRDDLVYHIKYGDEFGRKGWTASEVIGEIAALVGMEVVYSLDDSWAPDVFVPVGDSVLRIVLELASVFNPIFELVDDVLIIRPRPPVSGAVGLTGNAAKVTNSSRAESMRFAADASVKADGGRGPFRPDKVKTDIDTGFVFPSNRWGRLWADDSFRVRKIIDGVKWQGRVEVDTVVTESEPENEYRVEKRYWLISPTGGRWLELASSIVVYGTSGSFKEMKRLEETVHIFEGLNWSIANPRPIKSITVISGYGWGDPKEIIITTTKKIPVDDGLLPSQGGMAYITVMGDSQTITEATSRWYSPLEMTVTTHSWPDDTIGVQESESEVKTAVLGTFEDAPEADEIDEREWVRVDNSGMSEDDAANLREIRPNCDNVGTNWVESLEAKYVPISPDMYQMTQKVCRRFPKVSKRTTSRKIALADMPQSPLTLRGMNVYYEENIGGEGVKDTPGVVTYQPSIIDWDDMEAHGIEAAKERGLQYESSVDIAGGIIMLPRGMPVSINGEVNGELIGMSIALSAEAGLRATAIIKQRQVA